MKKGFTLMELLATILVLGIIALIATPIVLNVVENARQAADFESVRLYARAVENQIVSERFNNIKVEDGQYSITSSGDICLSELLSSGQCKDDNVLVINTSETKPTSGEIKIENGLVTDVYYLNIGNSTFLGQLDNLQTNTDESCFTTKKVAQSMLTDNVITNERDC